MKLPTVLKGVLTPRMAASQRAGAAGGKARAARHSREELQAWGEKGGNALLTRYGHSYFRHIRCLPRKKKAA